MYSVRHNHLFHLNTNQKYGLTKRNVPYYKFTSISHKFPNFIVPSKSREKKALYCVVKINKWETKNCFTPRKSYFSYFNKSILSKIYLLYQT